MVIPIITLLVDERIVDKLEDIPGYPSEKPVPPKAETSSKKILKTVTFESFAIR
jgi:hypothetical protein